MKFVAVLLTIAALFACPMNCLGGCEGSSGDGAAPQCRCCAAKAKQSKKGSDSQERSAPDGPCSCGNCICNGAVLRSDTGTQLWLPPTILFFEPLADAAIVTAVWPVAGATPDAFVLSGQRRKIVLRALLI